MKKIGTTNSPKPKRFLSIPGFQRKSCGIWALRILLRRTESTNQKRDPRFIRCWSFEWNAGWGPRSVHDSVRSKVVQLLRCYVRVDRQWIPGCSSWSLFRGRYKFWPRYWLSDDLKHGDFVHSKVHSSTRTLHIIFSDSLRQLNLPKWRGPVCSRDWSCLEVLPGCFTHLPKSAKVCTLADIK